MKFQVTIDDKDKDIHFHALDGDLIAGITPGGPPRIPHSPTEWNVFDWRGCGLATYRRRQDAINYVFASIEFMAKELELAKS